MSERNRELLSAYLDDDLSAEEAAELHNAWRSSSTSLAEVAQGYMSVGALMRGELKRPRNPSDMASRVRAQMYEDMQPDGAFSRALADVDGLSGDAETADYRGDMNAPRADRADAEDANVVRPLFGRLLNNRSAKTIGSLALAASVAAIAIIGVRQINQSDPTLSGSAIAAMNAVAVPSGTVAASYVAQPASQARQQLGWNLQQPAVERRLNAYLVQHSEVLGRTGRGMLPYARIVGFEPPRD